ncbi:acetyl-CoA C-acyltransferase [Sphingomonas changnyeongensis]|uniref:Acetyl-CoA C-acyltransferase n=1 Tax=Sphingomonas changnyeongensis TaxID=2698679 RepID=A0A7Z2NYY2_9SPHN|nr:acetyl-CoA C-acyltransferase [Sphingomonas changnyeongensis]QHL91849.1 acetyl-CoA C-acyltransferase [Sphingomonas changnyeongensis]
MSADPIVILSYARTPMGGFQGVLGGAGATALGASAVGAAVARAGVAGDAVERIYMGCVLPAGLGQAPARQAALHAGLPQSVEATTVNKMCGSGMQATIMAAEALAARWVDLIVAGGMESMTNAPYLMTKHRGGARIGHDRMFDHMYLDGLEDAYEPGKLMGAFAEEVAGEYQFSRAAQDDYAIASLTRAQAAQTSGAFDDEIVPVEIAGRKGNVTISLDEQPQKGDAAKIPTLRPAFAANGTITAANASSISDGAAALVLTRASVAERLGVTPVARIVAHAAHAHQPARFTTAPVAAMRKALDKAGWSVGDVDLFEVNEAFAVVAMIAMRDLSLAHDVVNIHGGACALGHPIGASGARILATLIAALRRHGQKRGLASLCIGGGEATAMAVELMA